jgi:hypothetical protein
VNARLRVRDVIAFARQEAVGSQMENADERDAPVDTATAAVDLGPLSQTLLLKITTKMSKCAKGIQAARDGGSYIRFQAAVASRLCALNSLKVLTKLYEDDSARVLSAMKDCEDGHKRGRPSKLVPLAVGQPALEESLSPTQRPDSQRARHGIIDDSNSFTVSPLDTDMVVISINGLANSDFTLRSSVWQGLTKVHIISPADYLLQSAEETRNRKIRLPMTGRECGRVDTLEAVKEQVILAKEEASRLAQAAAAAKALKDAESARVRRLNCRTFIVEYSRPGDIIKMKTNILKSVAQVLIPKGSVTTCVRCADT